MPAEGGGRLKVRLSGQTALGVRRREQPGLWADRAARRIPLECEAPRLRPTKRRERLKFLRWCCMGLVLLKRRTRRGDGANNRKGNKLKRERNVAR